MLKRKVLSGLDFPLITPERWLADVRALDLKPEVLPLILKDNGARVLGLRE
jgi:predicted TIM-barrel fold metal-dependent hydrolase